MGTDVVMFGRNSKADDAVKPLTAILTLNTIAHTMGAAGVGSEVQNQFGNEYLTVASVILTLAVLFLWKSYPKPSGPHIGNSCVIHWENTSHNHRCTRVYYCPNSVDEENPTKCR